LYVCTVEAKDSVSAGVLWNMAKLLLFQGLMTWVRWMAGRTL